MPIYLSASSIRDFVVCPQRVLYRLKKTVPEVKSKEMTMGNIVHLAIEKGWKDRKRAESIMEAEAKVQKLTKADRTNISFMLDIFFLNFQQRLGEGDLIEYNFKIPLYDDVFVVGKIDRISTGNLFDWKSGKVPKFLGNDVQCIIYEWAFQKLFDAKPKSINLASLSTGDLVPYYRHDMYYKELFTTVIPRMIKTIRHNEYERLGIFNHSCFRCVYKEGCLEGDKYELDNSIVAE